ncbi:MAG: hypothetical protein ABI137_10995 [Antricoccus sp.]
MSSETGPDRLLAMLVRAADGIFHQWTARLSLWTRGDLEILTDARADGSGRALAPHFLASLAGSLGDIGVIDATLVVRGTGGAPCLSRRIEVSVEVAPTQVGAGIGRSLIRDALEMVAADQPVFAAVAPGNARSLRGVGLVPIGSEVFIRVT